MCVQTEPGEEQLREKRKLEGVTQAKFGVKNAILGFVFGVSVAGRGAAVSVWGWLQVAD